MKRKLHHIFSFERKLKGFLCVSIASYDLNEIIISGTDGEKIIDV